MPARGRGWLEVKLWGGDSESVGAEYIDTVQYQGPYTVGSEDMDTSQATSHVPLSTHMVVVVVQFRRLALKSASDPPILADCRLEDRMRTRVFSPTYPTWALVGGTSRPAGETV